MEGRRERERQSERTYLTFSPALEHLSEFEALFILKFVTHVEC